MDCTRTTPGCGYRLPKMGNCYIVISKRAPLDSQKCLIRLKCIFFIGQHDGYRIPLKNHVGKDTRINIWGINEPAHIRSKTTSDSQISTSTAQIALTEVKCQQKEGMNSLRKQSLCFSKKKIITKQSLQNKLITYSFIHQVIKTFIFLIHIYTLHLFWCMGSESKASLIAPSSKFGLSSLHMHVIYTHAKCNQTEKYNADSQ